MKNMMFIFMLMVIVGGAMWLQRLNQQPEKSTHTIAQTETVLQQIRELNRLESNAFYVESIIKTEKQGNWYALWQDRQTAIFIAKGNVRAGVNLNKLSAKNVQQVGNQITLQLPPAEILSVQLDNIEVFDLKTGLFNVYQADMSVLTTVQAQAKQQILQQACRNGILQNAQQRSVSQIEQLFRLTNQSVVVQPAAQIGQCRVTASGQR